MIDQYGADLIEDLSAFTPSEVCSSVGLCAAPESASAAAAAGDEEKKKGKKTAPASPVATARRMLAEKHGIKVAFEDTLGYDAVGGPVACNTCKLAVTYAKSMLAENATRAEILGEMKSLCNLIPTRGGEAAVDCAALPGEDTRKATLVHTPTFLFPFLSPFLYFPFLPRKPLSRSARWLVSSPSVTAPESNCAVSGDASSQKNRKT